MRAIRSGWPRTYCGIPRGQRVTRCSDNKVRHAPSLNGGCSLEQSLEVGRDRARLERFSSGVFHSTDPVRPSVVDDVRLEGYAMEICTLGIDLGKTWFHVVGLDHVGHIGLPDGLPRRMRAAENRLRHQRRPDRVHRQVQPTHHGTDDYTDELF